MAPHRLQVSQHEVSQGNTRETEGSYLTRTHTVGERKRREAIDDRARAEENFRKVVRTAVGTAKTALKKRVEIAQLSVEEQE